jgi:WD40 repeat protein
MEETFSCEVCKKYYELPVMLPCGNSICLEHVLDGSVYKCKLCFEDHAIPENGLELNKSLQKVLNLNLHLNQQQKEVREALRLFEQIIDEFYSATNDSQKYLFDYIVDLKDKIDVEREKLMRDNKLDMLARINDYDEKCKRNLINLKNVNESNKSKYENLIQDFVLYREDLRKPKLSNQRLKEISQQIYQKINEMRSLITQSKNEMSLSKYYINIYPNSGSEQKIFRSPTTSNILVPSFSQTNNSNYNTIRTNNTTTTQVNNNSIRKSTSHTSFLNGLLKDTTGSGTKKKSSTKKSASSKKLSINNNNNNKSRTPNIRPLTKLYPIELNRSLSSLSVKSDQTITLVRRENLIKDYQPDRDMTGRLMKTIQAHSESVRFIKFLGNKLLASSSQDRLIKIWNMNTGEVTLTLKGHDDTVSCLELYNENTLLSGSWDSSIKIWDLKTGELLNTLKGHVGSVICFWLMDNDDLLSGSSDFTIKVWSNILDLNAKPKLSLSGHTSLIRCLRLNFDGKLISGSNDKLIKLWNLETGVCEKTLYGHSGSVNCLEVIPDEKILSGSTDATIKLWDLETSTCIKTINEITTVLSLRLITNDYLISGTSSKNIRIWDLNKATVVKELAGHVAYVIGFDLLPDGYLVSCSGDKTIKIWEI